MSSKMPLSNIMCDTPLEKSSSNYDAEEEYEESPN